ncbi:hypothetical protein CYMTET_13782 [Cymbomonas tetramitiformis]|uniref:Saccharopine dehydrogenase NADP binding domain-containing protein n=1 Tax=Cymbomonas tetramitiformis TaxID=36881 RepID=A0AAE0LAI5_9CHLO|nr:hypothetical protein CYMTET_13782 [Cymbomonas tetramitiformis]
MSHVVRTAIHNTTCSQLGGTGRVGSSTAAAILGFDPNVDITLASRNRDNMASAKESFPALKEAVFQEVDVTQKASILAALQDADLVVHCAGPFQKTESCEVLEAAIESKVPYIDVCDDTDYSQRAKELHEKAQAAGVPAITTCGIYPGVSNVMAAEMIYAAEEGRSTGEDSPAEAKAPEAGSVKPSRLLYSYFTAGSGGAGPTILTTSFLLCAEEVVAWKDGEEVRQPPASNRRVINFGKGVGNREVFLYNLPEVASAREIFDVPSVSARFGTSPGIWNFGMQAVAALPKAMISSPAAAKALAALADPFVRIVDKLVGELVAMRVDVDLDDGSAPSGLYVHKKLSSAVGESTAAFAMNVLEGGAQPGVWYPEEKEAVKDRRVLLERAAKNARLFILNKPSWMLESDAINIGFGFYWT